MLLPDCSRCCSVARSLATHPFASVQVRSLDSLVKAPYRQHAASGRKSNLQGDLVLRASADIQSIRDRLIGLPPTSRIVTTTSVVSVHPLDGFGILWCVRMLENQVDPCRSLLPPQNALNTHLFTRLTTNNVMNFMVNTSWVSYVCGVRDLFVALRLRHGS